MDWITLLRSLQSDFIKRLTSGCLLHCEKEGQYSELTIISGARLKALREFCWLMAEKYKRTSPVRDVFINNLKGKLGEEVVKERLADFITEVDYEKRFGGDGKIDFTLTANPGLGVEVKSRHGSFDKVKWSVSAEEVQKNAVVVCVLIQEEVNEAQSKYHLFLAGFLPTQMIKLKTGRISFGINQLLYGGGLSCYLEQLQSSTDNSFEESNIIKSSTDTSKNKYSINPTPDLSLFYHKLGDEYLNKCEYTAAINNYNQALKFNSADPDIYYKIGLSKNKLGDHKAAIIDYTKAINLNINYVKAYNQRGLIYYELGDYESAIADYTEVIRINPDLATAYKNRADARFYLGDKQGAIEDYTYAIQINPDDIITDNNQEIYLYLLNHQHQLEPTIDIHPDDAIAYKNRGDAKLEIGDKQGAIADFQKAADLYWQEGKLEEHQNTKRIIIDLEIEASLDILRF
ncbi:tetratricopeptide repeat protein [Cronbergia sp. UHCC 0137]|uniref:tetratricopeptide repeat protein n=1 Tax=Cronbergia sp. UHCC 0137 TaxID=3110239 RepID=UPI002B21B170|nr:tetratricopeptide repeat protein [Cronbergia sp. UHCC 0137]MEA5619432.1 tetratricopeptide repeat protein [Cronbergia sp. UHCC 0137]